MMIGASNSITLTGIASFTSPNFYANLAAPNSIPKPATFSLSLSPWRTTTSLRILSTPISAVNSGLEASITDSNDISVFLTDATVLVQEPRDEDKIQLRVNLNGDQTQKVFDRILVNLGRKAPPVPGFRMRKGGKSSKIPKSFLLEMLGEDRVTKFAIQEILNCTMAEYVKKENLDAEDKKVSTIQTVQELKKSFRAGKEFGFDVIIEPKNA
ncbi:unnamed protein product [Lathyrus oleraceus]|uniref:peptidylprolyl isomerase n=1 Tax=Pisum sativum TaxID=3888 RepID=A0A9D5A039_PEA|nr:uncharacterized protein LOC127105694 [Pisum sativum]XP_050898850.1 uncharacterized protein LOC127105694 [Pisum sativum]KAI5390354.1 hypothetical protein KIW84_075608 [Pisum sativum]